MKRLMRAFIGFYKSSINPLLPSSCPYTPSCSAYMSQAVEKRGGWGILLGLWRIMCCNPFTNGGFDPVRDNFKGKAKWIL